MARTRRFIRFRSTAFLDTDFPTVTNKGNIVLEKAGFRKVSNYTILINLDKPEKDLWLSLEKKSARWGAKYAERNGLSFEEAGKEDIDEIYALYLKTAEVGGFEAEKREFLEYLRSSRISRLFVVKQNDKILGGGLLLIDKINNYSILNLTAVSEEGQKLQTMPFLYWNMIKYSKKLGLSYCDLGGYDNEAGSGDKTYNINKFKENFGGEILEQPIYATNWKYPAIRYLMRRLRFLKGWYKKEK